MPWIGRKTRQRKGGDHSPTNIRQAVVVVHGMGEQRPLETVLGFIDSAVAPTAGGRVYYSRPDRILDSFESRAFVAPRRRHLDGSEAHAKTWFYEYHWSHLMQDNKLSDVVPTLRRMLFLPIRRVPFGLIGVWLLTWALIGVSVWALVWGPLSGIWRGEDPIQQFLGSVAYAALLAVVARYLVTRKLPATITRTFVDVVRYLDSSPRSYEVRRKIRGGIITMLKSLQEARDPDTGDYFFDRIVLVGHSLGGFIAYDAVTYLWGQGERQCAGRSATSVPALSRLEKAASSLPRADFESRRWRLTAPQKPDAIDEFREAQRELWRTMRSYNADWLITDLVTVGTPMYFADRLLRGRRRLRFAERIRRRELSTCPPRNDGGPHPDSAPPYYSWKSRRSRLHEGAAFSVTRWTNLYFPARAALFGDWFGGPLGPLFGRGVLDVMVTGNGPRGVGARPWKNRLVPGLAHAMYFRFPDDDGPDAVATLLRQAMELDATSWVQRRAEL